MDRRRKVEALAFSQVAGRARWDGFRGSAPPRGAHGGTPMVLNEEYRSSPAPAWGSPGQPGVEDLMISCIHAGERNFHVLHPRYITGRCSCCEGKYETYAD